MTYEEFKHTLCSELKEEFPSGTSITIQSISHNNSVHSDALTILEPELNISPTIYLSAYFRQLQEGAPLSSILRQICAYYRKYQVPGGIDTSFFTCFDQVRSRIVYKLIHYEQNRELLQDIPHIPYLDLAIVFYCLLSKSQYENASVLIRKEHLDYWHISQEQLFDLARQNTPFLLSSCCDSMSELLLPVMEQLSPQEKEKTMPALCSAGMVPMYVLTNQQRYFGACCILYDDVLKEIADHLDSDLYILPSSVHEVILIPATVTDSIQSLSEMVCEVNCSEVPTEEILSDHIYCYHRATNRISM